MQLPVSLPAPFPPTYPGRKEAFPLWSFCSWVYAYKSLSHFPLMLLFLKKRARCSQLVLCLNAKEPKSMTYWFHCMAAESHVTAEKFRKNIR